MLWRSCFQGVLCKHLPTTYKNIRVKKVLKDRVKEARKKKEPSDDVVPTGASRPFKVAHYKAREQLLYTFIHYLISC